MEILKGTVILLPLSFSECLEPIVNYKYEFRRFKIQNLLCAVAIISARVLLSKYSHTIRVKGNTVLTYYTTHDFSHDPRPTTHDPRPTTHDPRQLFRFAINIVRVLY